MYPRICPKTSCGLNLEKQNGCKSPLPIGRGDKQADSDTLYLGHFWSRFRFGLFLFRVISSVFHSWFMPFLVLVGFGPG